MKNLIVINLNQSHDIYRIVLLKASDLKHYIKFLNEDIVYMNLIVSVVVSK